MPASAPLDPQDPLALHLVALESAALARWCRGDPDGFLELSAPDVVYFEPFLPHRLEGRPALAAHYGALRGKILADRWELARPCVQHVGDAAVLTFQFTSWAGTAQHRWNCTEVYRRDAEGWRIIQTHWSLSGPPA